MSDVDPDLRFPSNPFDRSFLRSLPRRIGIAQERDDAVQDVCLRLVERGAATYPQPVNPRSYMAKSVMNAVAGYLRRDKRRNEVHNEVAAILHGNASVASSERTIVEKQALLAVARALDELSIQTRRIFLMNRVEGYTYVEISRELGISEQTVHYHMRRAIDHLARLRDEIYEPAPRHHE